MTAELPAGGVPLDALLAHRAWVRALARRLVTDPNVADDVEQETWRMAFERPPQHASSLRAWLSAVVRNAARVSGRSRTRRRAYESAAPVRPVEPSPQDVVAEAEMQHRLVSAVLALDEPYRSAVLARFFEGREATEIATRSGVPVETVRTRLKRAVAMLRERMDAEIGDDDGAWCLLVLGWRPEGVPAPLGGARVGVGTSAGTGSGSASGVTAALKGAAGGMAMGLAAKVGIGAAVVVLALFAWRPWEEPALQDGGGVNAAAPLTETSHTSPRDGKRARPGDDAAATEQDGGGARPSSAEARLAACDRDLDLHGVVVRKDGTPVPDATLQAASYPWRRATALNWDAAFEASLGPSTISAADGTFALRLRRGESVSLRVSKAGLATLELVDRQAGERVRIVMGPGVRLVVAVKDMAGKPVPDVRLHVSRLIPRDGGFAVDVRGVTAADGTAAFADLPGLSGGLDVFVLPECRSGHVGMKKLKLPETGETRLDLVFESGRVLRGRVTDAVTGAPIGAARVGTGWPLIQTVTTEGDGTYVLDGWTGAGLGELHVLAPGYVRATRTVGASETLDFALQPGVAARGRVVAADGRPVGDALVACMAKWPGDRMQRTDSANVRTGDDGVFHLAGLDAARIHALTVVAPGRGLRRMPVLLPPRPSGEADLGDVVVPDARAIEGRVLDPTGDPAVRIPVSLTAADLPPGVAENLGMSGAGTRVTDDLGRFRFPDLAPGTYWVQVGGGGPAPRNVRVDLPADRDVLDVVLAPQGSQPPPPDDAAAVTVTVTDEAGEPVAGLLVIANTNSPLARNPLQANTDASGRVVLRPPSGERIQGTIQVANMDPSQPFLLVPRIAVETGRTEYAVQIERGVPVTYVVRGPDGAPLPRAIVGIEPSGRAATGMMTDADGRGRVVLPREGTFRLVFDGYVYDERNARQDLGLEAHLDSVTAASDEVVLRARRVETGRSMSVRVLEIDGRPAEDVSIVVYAPNDRAPTIRTTDASGRAQFDGLPGRPLRVFFDRRAGDRDTRPGQLYPTFVRVVPAGQELVVRFPTPVEISGTVRWSTGETVRASVTVFRTPDGESSPVSWAHCDADGRFTVKIPEGDAGPFHVRANAARADGTQADVRRPVAATDRDVQLVLPR